jgi:hypothetical protein
MLVLAGVLPVVVAGTIALAGCGGDDTKTGPSSDARTQSTGTQTAPPTTEPQATTKAPPSALLRKRRRDRAERGIQTAVNTLVGAAEAGDGRRFCDVVGRQASGSGLQALQTCARSAGIQPEQLPTSDELSIEKVRLSGDRATVTVTPSTRIVLRRRGDVWTVAAVKPAA